MLTGSRRLPRCSVPQTLAGLLNFFATLSEGGLGEAADGTFCGLFGVSLAQFASVHGCDLATSLRQSLARQMKYSISSAIRFITEATLTNQN